MNPQFGRSQRKAFPKKKRNNRSRRAVIDGIVAEPNSYWVIPRRVGLGAPDRLYTSLRFWKSLTFNLSVNGQAGARLIPTNAFDVDPTLGSTSMPFFSELAAIYGRYRVTTSKAKFEIVNSSNITPVEAILIPLNTDPGPTPTAPNVISWRANPYGKSKMTGLTGSPTTVITNSISTEKIFGSKMVYYDDAFQSVVTTGPTNNFYWEFAVFSFAAIPTLIYANIACDVGIEFFDRTWELA